jgi:hypothetical protein
MNFRAISIVLATLWAPRANAAGWNQAPSAEVLILVDGSGSMLGYHETGALNTLVRRYQDASVAAKAPAETTTFMSGINGPMSTAPFDAWSTRPSWGKYTDLSGTLDLIGSTTSVVVLITDNVHDPDSEGAGASNGTDTFYGALQQRAFSKTWLNLHLLDFDGPVEVAKGPGVPDDRSGVIAKAEASLHGQGKVVSVRDRERLWLIDYRGSRALAAYVFALNDEGAVIGEALTARFKTNSDASMLIVPMDESVLELGSAPTFRVSDAARGCHQAEQPAVERPANLELQYADGRASLSPMAGLNYDPRLAQRFVANILLRSAHSHIQIGEVKPEPGSCRGVAAISIVNPTIRATGIANKLTFPDPVRAWSSPDNFSGDLRSGDSDVASAQIVMDMPPVAGPDVPPELLRDNISVSAEISITIPGSSFNLAPEVWRKYFTSDSTDLLRLYSPDDPVRRLASSSVRFTVPLSITSDVFAPPSTPPAPFPWAPVLALVGAALAGALVTKPLSMSIKLRTKQGDSAWLVGEELQLPWVGSGVERRVRVAGGQLLLLRRRPSLRPTLSVQLLSTGATAIIPVPGSARLSPGGEQPPLIVEVLR